MSEIIIKVPPELEKQMKGIRENWSDVALRAIKLRILRKKLESKEEKDFIKWSVELGRRAKKESWKKLLSELSPKERAELLK